MKHVVTLVRFRIPHKALGEGLDIYLGERERVVSVFVWWRWAWVVVLKDSGWVEED